MRWKGFVILVIIAAAGYGGWTGYKKYRVPKEKGAVRIIIPQEVTKLLQTAPSQAQKGSVQAGQNAQAQDAQAPMLVPTVVEGKIEEVTTSSLASDKITRLVMITNHGELVMLTNPLMVNTLQREYLGRLITLKGSWFGEVLFRGKMYRCLWAERVAAVQPLPEKKPKINKEKQSKTKKRR